MLALTVLLLVLLLWATERTWLSMRSVPSLEKMLAGFARRGEGVLEFGYFRRLSPEMIIEVAAHHGLRPAGPRTRTGDMTLELKSAILELDGGDVRG